MTIRKSRNLKKDNSEKETPGNDDSGKEHLQKDTHEQEQSEKRQFRKGTN